MTNLATVKAVQCTQRICRLEEYNTKAHTPGIRNLFLIPFKDVKAFEALLSSLKSFLHLAVAFVYRDL